MIASGRDYGALKPRATQQLQGRQAVRSLALVSEERWGSVIRKSTQGIDAAHHWPSGHQTASQLAQ